MSPQTSPRPASAGVRAREARVVRMLPLVALALGAVLVLVVALLFGGGSTGGGAHDPGAAVRWGLPVATTIVDLSAAGAIGALVLSVFALAPSTPARARALDLAAGSAAVLTLSSASTAVLIFLDVSGSRLVPDDAFGATLGSFLTTAGAGRDWLATTLLAAVLTVLCFAVRQQTLVALVAVVGVAALLPMAMQDQKSGTPGSDQAVAALGLHLVFAAIWLGGLITLVVIRPVLSAESLVRVARRYSFLAGVAFIVVAFSGSVVAELRIGSLARLLDPYGVLVLVKVAALIVLGVLGAILRTRISRRFVPGHHRFGMFVAGELALLGVATGAAAVLARTTAPVSPTLGAAPTPAEILTGAPLPAPLDPARYLTGFELDPIWLLVVAFGVAFYLVGLRRLRARGERWPVARTVSWFAGLLLLLWVTNGGVRSYGTYLFSSHLVATLVLAAVIPLLLVPGAPVALALRTIRERTDDSRGVRERILLVRHAPVLRVLVSPIVAAILLAALLWAFTVSPLLRWATTDLAGHEWMIALLLVGGCLFVRSLVDRRRPPPPFRAAVHFVAVGVGLVGTLASYAGLGALLSTSGGLLVADWFGAMGRTWGDPPLADQHSSGVIVWTLGGATAAALAIVVIVRWGRERRSFRLHPGAGAGSSLGSPEVSEGGNVSGC